MFYGISLFQRNKNKSQKLDWHAELITPIKNTI